MDVVERFRDRLCVACAFLKLLSCLLLLLLRHMQTLWCVQELLQVCAGKHRPFCIRRESGDKPQLTSRGMWVHSLVLKRFVWPSEHDLHWDPGAVSSPSWPGSTENLPL